MRGALSSCQKGLTLSTPLGRSLPARSSCPLPRPKEALNQHARHASSSIKRQAPEPRRPDGLRSPQQPIQRWSTRTMIFLSSAVGASTFMIGANQGYHAGKRAGIEEVELRGANPASSATVVDKIDANTSISPAPATATPA